MRIFSIDAYSFFSLCMLLSLILSIILIPVYPAQSIPTATVSVSPSTVTASKGQNFSISVSVSSVLDLYGWRFKLSWNTTLLDVVNTIEGPFLKAGGSTFFTYKINDTLGYILADCTLLGNVSGVSGSGTLANVKFYAKNQGKSILGLYDTMLVSSQEQLIIHTVNNGTVTITNPSSVGGIWITPNKLELLAPYIGLALAISIAAVVTVVLVKRRKKKQ